MTQEAAVPGNLNEQMRRIAREEVAAAFRSAPLRNASISGGEGLTVGAGSKLQVKHPTGGQMLLVGIYDVSHDYDLGDGSYQPMLLLRRADGTLALSMYDPNPGGSYQQFIAMWDRVGNIWLSDDTTSGQGMARPYLDSQPRLVRFADWPSFALAATSTWETVYSYAHTKQHPRLEVGVYASMDTAATTGNLRVMVDGVQLGSTAALAFAQGPNFFGPANVAGAHMQVLDVQIQVQRTTATGGVKLAPAYCRGRQSP